MQLYAPAGFDREGAVYLATLVDTAYDMFSQWVAQGHPAADEFRWTPQGPALSYSAPVWGTTRELFVFRHVEPFAFVASAAGFFLTGAFGVAAAFAVFIATNFLTTFIALGVEAFAAFIATSFLTTFIAVRTLAVFAAVIWRVIAFIAMAMGLWDCVAASASAFGARHACCVCASFFCHV